MCRRNSMVKKESLPMWPVTLRKNSAVPPSNSWKTEAHLVTSVVLQSPCLNLGARREPKPLQAVFEYLLGPFPQLRQRQFCRASCSLLYYPKPSPKIETVRAVRSMLGAAKPSTTIILPGVAKPNVVYRCKTIYHVACV